MYIFYLPILIGNFSVSSVFLAGRAPTQPLVSPGITSAATSVGQWTPT